MNYKKPLLHAFLALGVASTMAIDSPAQADSVAQVQTAKRISRQTVVLIDPQGRPGTTMGATDTTVQPGDILTFVIQFTPVPNGATRGLGGYVTDYIPRNTEVVGARIVDSEGNTIPPKRGGLGPDGVGPRGAGDYGVLPQGSVSQLYADTGIFYSTDPLTDRYPDGAAAGEAFISLFNGIPMIPEPTGVGQLDGILGAGGTTYAHNRWDWAQALAFGVDPGVAGDGKGNTPHLYGSAVAGPDSWYPYEATYTGPDGAIPDATNVVLNQTTGPWERIRTFGQEIGRAGAIPDANGDMPDPGIATRVGVPAVDANGELLGWALSPSQPLPSYDPANPGQPYVRAVRFALGELVVGEEYFAEISLRVKALPLDPVSGLDINCAEVFGGDASAQEADGSKGGKDNAWRYFLPAPSCVVLNNFFELSVDKIAALDGETLTYTLEGKNLSTMQQTGVVARQCFPGDINFVSATGGGTVDNSGTGCPNGEDSVVWNIGTLAAGQDYNYTVEFTINGGRTVLSRAIYTSDALPAPGFQVVAMTNVEALSVIDFDATVSPDFVATPPGTVHYIVTVTNTGTGTTGAAGERLIITLPDDFSFVPGSAAVDMAAVGDPAVVGTVLEFSGSLVDLPPGGSFVVEFDAAIDAAAQDGLYGLSVESWFAGAGGKPVNDAETNLALVAVGIERSEVPTLSGGLLGGSTTVSGTTNEGAGTTIEILVNGVVVATTTSDMNGDWVATVPELFAGQQVTARATAPGELVSPESSPPILVASAGSNTACNNGEDDDGDGLTDFPDDPGCTDANDVDETDPTACSDGVDNDGNGLADYPEDPSCASYRDDVEDGVSECEDGIDNDGDGATDGDDPECANDMGRREASAPACADGQDNDGDGATDYPFDPGCDSSTDDDETDMPSTRPDAGFTDTDAGGMMETDAGTLTGVDPGGIGRGSSSGEVSEGCCSQVPTRKPKSPFGLLIVACVIGLVLRRRMSR